MLFQLSRKAFGNSKALRAFISTNVALSTQKVSVHLPMCKAKP